MVSFLLHRCFYTTSRYSTGRANTGDKMMTLVASALAGGDCIDDADSLRAGVLFTSLN